MKHLHPYKKHNWEDTPIFLNSPLNLLGKFAEFFRVIFTQPDLPWRYDDNMSDATMYVCSEYNYPEGVTNLSPAIVVTRGSLVHQRVVVGDTDQTQPHDLKGRGKYQYAMGEMDIRIECTGQTYGESALMADIVQNAIIMTREKLCKEFSLRDISASVQSPVAPHTRDEHKFMTTVDFRVSFEFRWFTVDYAPVMRSASLHIEKEPDT